MLSLKFKDIKIRKFFSKFEKLIKIKKYIRINLLNTNLLHNLKEKNAILSKINRVLKQSSNSKVKIVRRCILNNRGRAVFRPYNISRTLLRELMQFGIIPGYAKAVW
jgi:ribosomal protein S14